MHTGLAQIAFAKRSTSSVHVAENGTHAQRMICCYEVAKAASRLRPTSLPPKKQSNTAQTIQGPGSRASGPWPRHHLARGRGEGFLVREHAQEHSCIVHELRAVVGLKGIAHRLHECVDVRIAGRNVLEGVHIERRTGDCRPRPLCTASIATLRRGVYQNEGHSIPSDCQELLLHSIPRDRQEMLLLHNIACKRQEILQP